jgi:hypothetical protein
LAREAALVHRVALATEGIQPPGGAWPPQQARPDGRRFTSDTGECVWDLTDKNRGVVTVNAPRSKAVIGFGGGKRFDLGGVLIEPGSGLQDGWSALTLTAMDAAPAAPSKWLITATSRAENTGQQWKTAEKNSVGRNWGTAPSRVEGVSARVTLPHPAARVEAWSLDERGHRKQKLSVATSANGQAVLELGPQWQTLWYEVGVRR